MGWFVSDIVGNPEDWFSHVVAQVITKTYSDSSDFSLSRLELGDLDLDLLEVSRDLEKIIK